MSTNDHGLVTERLIDCFGQVTHDLTLEYDGTVTLQFAGGHTVRIDPTTRTVLTSGASVEPQLMDLAASMRVE